jgi:hypothetical protein
VISTSPYLGGFGFRYRLQVGNPDKYLSLFLSVPAGKCWDSTFNLAIMTFCFYMFYSLLFILSFDTIQPKILTAVLNIPHSHPLLVVECGSQNNVSLQPLFAFSTNDSHLNLR